MVARTEERVLHQARVGLHEFERPLHLASPEDDPCQGVAEPSTDEVRDERARAEQRAGLSKEEAARRRHESAEREEAANESSPARDDSQARAEQFDACILHSDHFVAGWHLAMVAWLCLLTPRR